MAEGRGGAWSAPTCPSEQREELLGLAFAMLGGSCHFSYVLLTCLQNEPAVKNTVVYVSADTAGKKCLPSDY